ncbi:MAG: type II toxin-antitoxin system HipA family toxin [Deltaproteobacteria bacterium]|nr:type II toxin-antitoxin system HipA family toxin [Deltaproteobacteria bacterium]
MKKLTVTFRHDKHTESTVGTLAEQDHRIYFEYDQAWLNSGIELSPFKLPLKEGLFEHKDLSFGPLPGLFDDSLPDGWGLLLMDRHFRKKGINPATLSPLERLSYVGMRAMGALAYNPSENYQLDQKILDLHALGKNAEEVFRGDVAVVLPELERAGGSPGGARPKMLVGVRDDEMISGETDLPEGFEHWLIKFAAQSEPYIEINQASQVEYAYALMAKDAGINMPKAKLFHACNGKLKSLHFGVKRFDRDNERGLNKRRHLHTFGNLIHAFFRIPSTDYADLFKLTRLLTRNHHELLKLFRRMVFNITSHNRDDHAKNFSFMITGDDETTLPANLPANPTWILSPAYDLTFTHGIGGEHTMSVLGEGKNPTRAHCLALAEQFGILKKQASGIIDEVNQAVQYWPDFAEQAGCAKKISREIQVNHFML